MDNTLAFLIGCATFWFYGYSLFNKEVYKKHGVRMTFGDMFVLTMCSLPSGLAAILAYNITMTLWTLNQ